MSNYPDGMVPGEEDGPRTVCDRCGHPIIWPATPYESDRGLYCRECMDETWPNTPGDPDLEPFELACSECGAALTAANVNWDEEGGCYICDQCWRMPPEEVPT